MQNMHEKLKANQRATKHAELLFSQLSQLPSCDLMETTSRHKGYLCKAFSAVAEVTWALKRRLPYFASVCETTFLA